jgi:protein-disulfide isomerase
MRSVALLTSLFLLTGCLNKANLKKMLKENPDILVDAIKDNPTEVLTALQDAAMKAREEMAKKREVDDKKETEGFYDNPLKPELKDSDIIRGTKGAPIVLVEYSDFQCPFCTRGFNTVKDILKKYPGKVHFVYKHLPLRNHPEAMPAARYFEAIAMQSEKKAWAFHDGIFADQQGLRKGVKFLDKLAKKVGVNMSRLKSDLKKESIDKTIRAHMMEAEKFGIQGTPGFVMNGIPVKGAYPLSHFEDLIQKLTAKGKLSL